MKRHYSEFRKLSIKEQNNFTGVVVYPQGTLFYLVKNKRHRVDGPAVVYTDGSVEYWIDHKKVSKEAQELYHSLMKLKGLI